MSETQNQIQPKQKKHQLVGFNEIKLFTMLIHFQKQEYGLVMTPDEEHIKKVPKNDKYLINQLE